MAFQSEELESVTQVPFVTFSPKVDVVPGFNAVVVMITGVNFVPGFNVVLVAVNFKYINNTGLAQQAQRNSNTSFRIL